MPPRSAKPDMNVNPYPKCIQVIVDEICRISEEILGEALIFVKIITHFSFIYVGEKGEIVHRRLTSRVATTL